MPWRVLLQRNRAWAERIQAERPGFFAELARQQSPRYMWIGCSDSRVPANQITGLEPGEVFVHRNVANVVVPSDLNCLSAVQYAVDVLRVEHVMVVGHYGCGGVQAALLGQRVGLADNWLRHVRGVAERHADTLQAMAHDARLDALCELNVIEQVRHVAQSTVLQDAWARGQAVTVHGWVYGLRDGLLQDLGVSIGLGGDVEAGYAAACAAVRQRRQGAHDRPAA
ncbi:carbonate dehydratase [Tepidimonas ignava]|uniref:carbonate dehydratase n=1 Tax=Tepidimonas ignava TaxID=114249 RepID=UPI002FDAB83C